MKQSTQRRRVRRMTLAVGALIVGAAINVLVAWASTPFIDPWAGETVSPAMAPGWYVDCGRGAEGPALADPSAAPMAADIARVEREFWSISAHYTRSASHSSFARFSVRPTSDNLDVDVTFAVGFPMLSMRGVIPPASESIPLLQAGLDAGQLSSGARTLLSGTAGLLPIEPLMPGFIVNSLGYAVIVCITARLFISQRRRLRLRRGRCPQCGYELESLGLCPECGAPAL